MAVAADNSVTKAVFIAANSNSIYKDDAPNNDNGVAFCASDPNIEDGRTKLKSYIGLSDAAAFCALEPNDRPNKLLLYTGVPPVAAF